MNPTNPPEGEHNPKPPCAERDHKEWFYDVNANPEPQPAPVAEGLKATTGEGHPIRVEKCQACQCFISDWVEAEQFNGRICRPCESLAQLRAENEALSGSNYYWRTQSSEQVKQYDELREQKDIVEKDRDVLMAFKTWVHSYLDDHEVPHHPPGTHGAEGCRIGDRMDWLMAQLARLREQKEAVEPTAREEAWKSKAIAAESALAASRQREAELLAELNAAHNALDLAAQRFDSMDLNGFRNDCMDAILKPTQPTNTPPAP